MEIEILINGVVHIVLAVLVLKYIDAKCYPATKAFWLFIIPMWLLFLGFYYIRNFIDQDFEGRYWRAFRIFETITDILFCVLLILKIKFIKR